MKESVRVFLESGLLEEYMMGTCSSEQIKEVEFYLDNHPEVKSEYDSLQNEINTITEKFTNDTPKGLKEAIISCLEDDSNYKVKTVFSKKKGVRLQFMPWAAACIALIASISLFNQKTNLQGTNMEIHAKMNMVQHQLETAQSQMIVLEEELFISGHDKTSRLLLKGNDLSPSFSSTAFWNDVAGKAILYVNALGDLGKNQCYQIWADVDGEMINAGILPTKKGPIEINFLRNATSLNITIEPKGGSDHPNVANLICSQELLKI